MFPVPEQTTTRQFVKPGMFDGFRQKLLRNSLTLSDPHTNEITVERCELVEEGAGSGRGWTVFEAFASSGCCAPVSALIAHSSRAVPAMQEFGLISPRGKVCELCSVSPTGERVPITASPQFTQFMAQFRALYRYALSDLSAGMLVAAVRAEDLNFFEGILCFRRTTLPVRNYLGVKSTYLELDLTRSGVDLFDLYAGSPLSRNVFLYLHSEPDEGDWTAQPASADEWRLA